MPEGGILECKTITALYIRKLQPRAFRFLKRVDPLAPVYYVPQKGIFDAK